MAISWQTFRRALAIGNRRLRLIHKPEDKVTSLGAMVYLYDPSDPDGIDKGTYSGLSEVLAIASPSFFRMGCPELDVALDENDIPGLIPSGKKRWVRGYSGFFRKLATMSKNGKPLIDAEAVKAFLPRAFRRWNNQKFKDAVVKANFEAKTELQKKAEWLKGRRKAIPGNGMPLGWKPTKIMTTGTHSTAGAY
jgi:hypothetical protein